MKGSLFGKLAGWLDLLLESRCPLCDRSTGQSLCLDCQQQLQQCQLANREEFWQAPLPVFAWGLYGGALKRSIATLKYNNQPQLARPMGQWLGQSWLRSPVSQTPVSQAPVSQAPVSQARSLLVVPIPMHADKQRQRGFNQAELIGRSFCEQTGLPLQIQGLVRVRATEAQFSLSAEARAQNLAGAFQVGAGLKRQSGSRSILLIDDIYTTGATARAAVTALRRQGLSVYGLVALAKSGGMPQEP